MRHYGVYAAVILLLAVALTICLIWLVCSKIEKIDKKETETTPSKLEYSIYAVTFVSAIVCILLTIEKRQEFFGIFAPIFIGLPGTLFLTDLLTPWKLPVCVMEFALQVGLPLQQLLFALQYLRASFTVPIYFLQREKLAGRKFEKCSS